MRTMSKSFDLLIGVASASRGTAACKAFLHDAEALPDGTALTPLCFGAETCRLRADLTGIRHDLRGIAYFTGATRTETAEREALLCIKAEKSLPFYRAFGKSGD